MSRSRRSGIDQNFDQTGQMWSGGYDQSFLSGEFDRDPRVFATTPLNLGGLEAITQLVFWNIGLVSFGPPTLEQGWFIDAYSDGDQIFGPNGFPGDFFLIGANGFGYSGGRYGNGIVDFERPYFSGEAIPTTFFAFGTDFETSLGRVPSAQLVLTSNDFTIFKGPAGLYGYQIDGRTSVMSDEFDSQTIATNDFFRFTGTSEADEIDASQRFSSTLVGLGGDDILRGGSAGDRIIGGAGTDRLSGGGGRDAFTFQAISESSVSTAAVDLITDFTIGVDYIDASAITGATSVSNRLVSGLTEISIITDAGTLLFYSVNPVDNASIVINLQLTGTSRPNTLTGLAGNDTISGLGGNDTLSGGLGNDRLEGGAGADTLSGGIGSNVFVFRSVSDSSITANSVDLITDFESGTDLIEAFGIGVNNYSISFVDGATQLTLSAPTGQLLIRSLNLIVATDIRIGSAIARIGTSNIDTLAGLDGDDTIDGQGGNDIIFGNDGNDTLRGGDGTDTLAGGSGDDHIEGEADSDSLRGEAGNDVLLGGAGNDSVSGGLGDDRIEGGIGSDSLSGDDGRDVLLGGEGNDLLNGGGESDTLNGGDGADNLDGGVGSDTIEGGLGGDRLTGSSQTYLDQFGNLLTGDQERDTYLFRSVLDSPEQGQTDTIVNFETGIDIIDVSDLLVSRYEIDLIASTLTINTPDGTLLLYFEPLRFAQGSIVAVTDIRFGRLMITGTAGDDELYGFEGNDIINGGSGDDVLRGNLGNDVLRGEAGRDFLGIDAGDDVLDGGSGTDTLVPYDTSVALTIDLALGTLRSAGGNDTLISIENASGGSADDTLIAIDRKPAEVFKEQYQSIATNATAQSLNARFGLEVNTDIENATSIPHVTVYGVANGGPELYLLTAAAGAQLVVDIDGTSGFDSFIEVWNSAGARVFFNDDYINFDNGDPGSTTALDSRLSGTLTEAGDYYVHVLRYQSATTGAQIAPGGAYTMHVSLTGGALSNIGSSLNGGSGDDLLISGRSGDVLDGGFLGDSDTASYQNARNGVTANLALGVATGDGNDSLFRIANLTGSAFADTLTGDSGNNILNGGAGNDALISGSSNDTLLGGDGNDGLFFGAFFSAADTANGGAGTLDQVGLQGDYSAGVTLGASSAIGVEQFVLLPGNDTRFGAPGTQSFSYNVITGNAAIAAGQQLVLQANTLRAGENFTLDARGELDGLVFTYGGQGSDRITGSQTGDAFFFGSNRFNPTDVIDGQGGIDQIGLQGSYSGANAIVLGAGQILNVEAIVLLTNSDSRFGGVGTTPFSYDLTTNNANVAAGQRLAIQANTLASNEVLRFNGSAETDGSFSIFSGNGNDVITGSRGGDTISGRGGADTLAGGGGNDIFLYTNISDSTAAARDMITDFSAGDRIDLSRIDAITGGGDNAFTLIGSAAFGNIAGQLRLSSIGGGVFAIEGDVNGDGVADFSIFLTNIDAHPITTADFAL